MKIRIQIMIKISLKTITIPEENNSFSDSISLVTLVTTLPIGVLSKNFNASLST
jgi:hypothetical protein